jgi:hypothetical protein
MHMCVLLLGAVRASDASELGINQEGAHMYHGEKYCGITDGEVK